MCFPVELPPQDRYKYCNILLTGLWYVKNKPYMNCLWKDFLVKLQKPLNFVSLMMIIVAQFFQLFKSNRLFPFYQPWHTPIHCTLMGNLGAVHANIKVDMLMSWEHAYMNIYHWKTRGDFWICQSKRKYINTNICHQKRNCFREACWFAR